MSTDLPPLALEDPAVTPAVAPAVAPPAVDWDAAVVKVVKVVKVVTDDMDEGKEPVEDDHDCRCEDKKCWLSPLLPFRPSSPRARPRFVAALAAKSK